MNAPGANRVYCIGVIPGDGIGQEVIPVGIAVADVAAQKFGFEMDWTGFDWSCERFARTGRMMPVDGIEQVKEFDSLYLGAVGHPGVPDQVSLWGLLIPLQRELQQYVNVRPVHLLNAIVSPDVAETTSTSSSFARTTKVNIQRSAA